MEYEKIISNVYSEPAALIRYKDGDFRAFCVNDRFIPELWMNIAEDEFLNAPHEKSFDERNLKEYKAALEKCAETGEEQEIETWRTLFSDCCGFDKICLRSRLIRVDDTPEGVIIYEGIRNISNEKRMQESLEDVEYRYKAASEQINIYNWEYIIATKEMRPCYRCMRDLGLPALVTDYPEPAIDMGIFPADYADMYRELMKKIDNGIPEIEADIPLTVGRVPFRVKYTTEYDENGKPVKAFGSATLISETEIGRIKLDNQIINTLAEGYQCIYVVDFIKNSVQIVKQDDILNLEENAYCKELAVLISSKLKESGNKYSDKLSDVGCLRNEMFNGCEAREFVYKDNSLDRWIRINYYVIERSNNCVDRMLIAASYVDDIRAQKMEADRVIASQKEELESRQKMLLEAINEVSNANKAKTEFFSNMSHDIRTPMNAIQGFSKLAIEEIDDREHLEEYLERIVNASDHLLNLINNILDMSRIESGKMELSTTNVKVKDLLLECADMISVKMDEKKIRFHVDVDNVGDDLVKCDKLHFNQVILNLLSNAYKFTPEEGSVYLSGKLEDVRDELAYEIRVKDNGIGMSKEFSRHIWEAYTREKSEMIHETQGTGLGMVIVKNIVTMMGGTVDFETELNKGTEFIIKVPLKRADADAQAPETDTKKDSILNKDFTGVTVLVVDDTEVNLKLADRILSKRGFTVKQVDSGIKAVDMVSESKPGDIDIILMDVLMPVMDGFEATAKIRALDDPDLAKIPIIAMTANAFESDVKKSLDSGMNAHVAKPFKVEDLVTKIDNNLP